jgi:hypothetical protein
MGSESSCGIGARMLQGSMLGDWAKEKLQRGVLGRAKGQGNIGNRSIVAKEARSRILETALSEAWDPFLYPTLDSWLISDELPIFLHR